MLPGVGNELEVFPAPRRHRRLLLPATRQQTIMAGGNLEIVKFAFYLAVPIAIMGYFGNTAFYKDQVFPDRSRYWPEHKGPVRLAPQLLSHQLPR